MAIEKSFADDAKTSNDPNDSAQNGAKAGADKSNGSKTSAAEIRERAYEILRRSQPGPRVERIGWQSNGLRTSR